MDVHLLRHGIAIDRDDPSCPTDPERFLTAKGIARTREAAQGLAKLLHGPSQVDAVVASPYVRAQQTADLASEILGLARVPRLASEALLPLTEPAAIVAELRSHAFTSVLLVGHSPHLDRLLAYLVGSERPITAIKKSGFATLAATTLGFGGSHLAGLYPPSVLRDLA